MAIGTTAAVLLGLGMLGGAGAAMYSSRQQRKAAEAMKPQPMAMPEAPKVEDAATKAREALRRRKRTRTIFTSPLGISGEAQIARKTLLGQ